MCTLKPFTFISSSKLTTPITSRSAVDSAIYLALVVLSAIKYCILIAHIIEQLVYIITYPVRECLDNGSSDDRCYHYPDQSTSTKHSNPFIFSGIKVITFSFVFNKYLHIYFTTSSCSCDYSLQNLAHCCTDMVMAGRIIAYT